METSLSNRLQATLLAVLTVGLVLLAMFNFIQEGESPLPDDGVWWTEAANGAGLIAEKVLPGTPGNRAGLQDGDLLKKVGAGKPDASDVNDVTVTRLGDFERELSLIGPFGDARYTIVRGGIPLEMPVPVIPDRQDRSLQQAERGIGLIYLAIGIYVLFRRWTAPRATHFYVFCLASFALYALKFTGAMDNLDATVYWCNVLAEALQPALFVHFALSFPEERLSRSGRAWLLPLVYLPGAAVLGLRLYAFHYWEATGLLAHWGAAGALLQAHDYGVEDAPETDGLTCLVQDGWSVILAGQDKGCGTGLASSAGPSSDDIGYPADLVAGSASVTSEPLAAPDFTMPAPVAGKTVEVDATQTDDTIYAVVLSHPEDS